MNQGLWMCAAICLAAGCFFFAGCATGPGTNPGKVPGEGAEAKRPPDVNREFRGVWIATVANIDWPSEPGLPVNEQRDELIALLDLAREMNLNAIIFQVRTTADALYDSPLEPWSAYLTGTQGQAPEPAYDPLAFAIEQAHLRGLELHAWINPLRASHPSYEGELVADHVKNTMPDATPRYGTMDWMDPGRPETLAHTLAVVKDIVTRYDIDGLHIDDYFYPYPQTADGKALPFPDQATYDAYRADGGRLSLNDWRRRNVDRMVQQMHRQIKAVKPYVKFGISPFGIWRPGYPEYIKGMDQYDVIYADARKWLEKGWCDYFTPQLYWSIQSPDQSFTGLLEWWTQHNPKDRYVWPGMYASRTANGSKSQFDGKQVPYQVKWSRILLPDGEAGHVHFSIKAFQKELDGLKDNLTEMVYADQAMTPEMSWLKRPAKLPLPEVATARLIDQELELTFTPDSVAAARWVVAQWCQDGAWQQAIAPAASARLVLDLPASDTDVPKVWVRSFDRLGHSTTPKRIDLNRSQP